MINVLISLGLEFWIGAFASILILYLYTQLYAVIAYNHRLCAPFGGAIYSVKHNPKHYVQNGSGLRPIQPQVVLHNLRLHCTTSGCIALILPQFARFARSHFLLGRPTSASAEVGLSFYISIEVPAQVAIFLDHGTSTPLI